MSKVFFSVTMSVDGFIMGKRMFDGGERHWPEQAPFHTPVFVLTRQVRPPWERPGNTTFYFVNDGIESALRQAREVANGKDIRIAGGAHTIREYLNAGLVDELHIALAPFSWATARRSSPASTPTSSASSCKRPCLRRV